ncbi:hypothetical protein HHK36_032811 [Tetracentron sinense]|uniref:Uncharacterized protein n=1 Tax=Tetracentron sinense TaxID=13715 RepID=A0A835CX10_TETSI|nr:hypothetical protein HHK36_033124 [Tetracentron sinense]KAF8365190.1 hypothetical protein HHK36_032811 [Tetracentron sinense]
MWNSLFIFMDLDGGSPYIFPTDPLVPHSFGGHILSQICPSVQNSLYHSKYLNNPGSLALQEAFNCISKFSGALFFCFSSGLNSNFNHKSSGNPKPRSCTSCPQVDDITSCRHNLVELHLGSRSQGDSAIPFLFGKIASSTMRLLRKEAEQRQSFSVLSLAAVLVPPFNNLRPAKVLAVTLETTDVEIHGT